MILFPNAKINIGLFVTEKRPDGFHNLETVFYPVKLCDVLEIHKEGGRGECFFHTSGIPIDCDAEKNLIVKAYRLLAAKFDLSSVYVHLHKIIPYGAGLGGGSADAAYMLKGLNELFELGLSFEQLEEYAGKLGSDCPFFIRNRVVYACGKGEIMTPIGLDLTGYTAVLVKPDRGVSTPEAYAGITPCVAKIDLRELTTRSVYSWHEYIYNDFERSVQMKVPEIGEIKEQLRRMGAFYVSMTGSGSAVYAFFEHEVCLKDHFPGYFTWQGVL